MYLISPFKEILYFSNIDRNRGKCTKICNKKHKKVTPILLTVDKRVLSWKGQLHGW